VLVRFDGISLRLVDTAFDFATLARPFLVAGLERCIDLAGLLLLRLVPLVEGPFDLSEGEVTLWICTGSTRRPVRYTLSSSCIFIWT
jgi:hypothetical protein